MQTGKVTGTRKNKRPVSQPRDIKPMLASLSSKTFDKPGWLYEIKLDGFRAISYVNNEKAEIRSRNNKVFNEKFYPVHEALKNWRADVIVDGEIVALNNKGYPDFEKLQLWRSEADGDLAYYVFDLLWYDGQDMRHKPLWQRREMLEKILPKDNEIIRLSESFEDSGKQMYQLASSMNLEGIIAKKKDSIYQPDTRSKEWLKIKTFRTQEAVIAGYTRNENSPKKFSSLILGIYEDDELIPIAPVGTGFTNKMQEEIIQKLNPLITKKCPFRVVPDYNKPSRFRPNPPKAEVTWVKPEIVAEISYMTVSSDGVFRHPSFRGLREDKSPKEVKWEHVTEKETSGDSSFSAGHRSVKEGRKTLLNPKEESQTRDVNGHTVKFTNLSKVFWPNGGITKRDVINYYYQAAEFILPYLKDRPQTLNRFPNGVNGKSFYQKDVKGKVPHWIDTFDYYSETDKRAKEFLVCTDEASLLYVANLGCIEINPWSSRKQTPDHPDWCIIDLDPDTNNFEQVITAARITYEVLNDLSIDSYCKTSGSTGLHIYIPLEAKFTYEDSKEFGRSLVTVVHKEIPGFSSIERLTSKRKGKLYLDFLQNRPQATVAAPYSLRPKTNPSVSMSLHWDEVKKGLSINDFTIMNAIGRMKETGDLFKGVLGKGVDILKAKQKLDALIKPGGN